MAILVTGGHGFIGSHLTQELRQAGKAVRVLDAVTRGATGESDIVGDVRDSRALRRACAGVDTIYHLAAVHRDDVSPPSLYREVNVEGTRNLLSAAVAAGVRSIIFASTVAVYGLMKPDARESDEPEPFNEYGRSKLEAERLLVAWAASDASRSLTIIRPSVVFGEGIRNNVYELLKQIHSGRFVMIGSGRNRKSMAYVRNLSHFLATLSPTPGVEVINYADKPDMTVGQIVAIARSSMARGRLPRITLPMWAGLSGGYVFDLLSFLTGRSFAISAVRIKKFCADTSIRTDKLEQRGFVRPYSLEEGLRRTITSHFGSAPAS